MVGRTRNWISKLRGECVNIPFTLVLGDFYGIAFLFYGFEFVNFDVLVEIRMKRT